MRLRSSVLGVVALVCLIVSQVATAAIPAQSETTTVSGGIDLDAPPVVVETRSMTVAGALLDAVEAVSDGQIRPSEMAEPISSDGRLAVSVLPEFGASDRVAAQIEELGGVVEARLGGMLQVLLVPDLVETVGSLPGVMWVDLQPRPTLHATAGEGIEFIRANEFHDAGVTGEGVDIGILDTGFAGIVWAQDSGDAPPDERWVKAYWGCDTLHTQTHGRQVAEVVYDIAPGATFHWACIGTIGQWESAVDKFIEAGVDIVVASLGYDGEHRGDGTGDIHDVVAAATAAGILWVNSAGNEAESHWGGDFASSDGDTMHEFSTGVEVVSVTVPDGQPLWISLRWDDWPTTAIDLNVYLWDPDIGWGLGKFLDTGEDPQTGTQPPKEQMYWKNDTGEEQEVYVTVTHNEATVPNVDLDVFTYRALECPGCDSARLGPGSLSAPADSPYAFSVGAVCDDTAEILPYSSQGPTKDGRLKPNMAAPSTVATTVRPTSSGCTAGFNGTSAAAPHVAGAAALIKELHPSYAWHELRDRLLTNYEDPDADGDDNVFGRGILRLATEAPVAATDYETVAEDGVVTVYMLDNDSDLDHDSIWVNSVERPSHGAVTWSSLGKVTYYHDGSEASEDWFTYEVTDGVFTSTGWIHITVLPVNDTPVAVDDGPFTVALGGVLNGSGLLDNDTDADGDDLVMVRLTAGPSNGILQALGDDGTFTYEHTVAGTTQDFFTYEVSDGIAWSNPATVAIGVASAHSFADIDGHWAVGSIEAVYAAGITNGCATDPLVFCPDDDVTRAELTAFILRALGEEGNLPAYQGLFPDVPPGKWYTGYVEKAAGLELVKGYTDGNFGPDDQLSRAEMAVVVIRALEDEDPPIPATDPFKDVPKASWYGPYVARLRDLGITVGIGDNLYGPYDPITRAEVATMIARAWNLPVP